MTIREKPVYVVEVFFVDVVFVVVVSMQNEMVFTLDLDHALTPDDNSLELILYVCF